jgi:hypothetical protein
MEVIVMSNGDSVVSKVVGVLKNNISRPTVPLDTPIKPGVPIKPRVKPPTKPKAVPKGKSGAPGTRPKVKTLPKPKPRPEPKAFTDSSIGKKELNNLNNIERAFATRTKTHYIFGAITTPVTVDGNVLGKFKISIKEPAVKTGGSGGLKRKTAHIVIESLNIPAHKGVKAHPHIRACGSSCLGHSLTKHIDALLHKRRFGEVIMNLRAFLNTYNPRDSYSKLTTVVHAHNNHGINDLETTGRVKTKYKSKPDPKPDAKT